MIQRAEASELTGTALLVYVIVGSGVVVQRLGADPAQGLFYHSIAVGLGLAALIALFGTTSGAHFNPAVTLSLWRRRIVTGSTALRYATAQGVGAFIGLALALATFGAWPAILPIEGQRWGAVLAEYVGTTILALIIIGAIDQDSLRLIPAMVGAWVAVMIFSSSSTGLMNPAVTLARVFTDTYTGIPFSTAPLFIVAQLLGGLTAVVLSTRLLAPFGPKGN